MVAPRAGRLRGLRFGDGVDWSEITILGAADLPAAEGATSARRAREPVLAGDTIHHAGQPVLLVAAPGRGLLCRAVAEIELEIDPPTLAGRIRRRVVAETRTAHSPLAGDDLASAATAIYRTPSQSWSELTPAIAIGHPDGAAHGSDGADLVHARLLATAADAPVQLVRACRGPTPRVRRHGAETVVAAGLDGDGRLALLDLACDLEVGAFPRAAGRHLAAVVGRGAGPYRWRTAQVRARAVTDDGPPCDALDDAAAPAVVARERHLDHVARAAGRDAGELRRTALVRDAVLDAIGPGDETAGLAVAGEDALGVAAARAAVDREAGIHRLTGLRLVAEAPPSAEPALRRLALREVGWALGSTLGWAAPRAADVPSLELELITPPSHELTGAGHVAGVVAAAVWNALARRGSEPSEGGETR